MSGTEIDFSRFKLRSDLEPHRQLAAYLKAQIALGALTVGDAVPGAAAVAYRTKVKPAGVRRAYAELAERGYLSSQGGKWRVSEDYRGAAPDAAEDICDRMWEIIVEGRQAGLTRTELERMFKLLLSR